MAEMNGTNGHGPSADVVSGGKTIITSKGIALHATGISPLLIRKLQSVGTLPDVPTRKIPLDFGGEEAFEEEPLSEKDLRDDDEKRRWKEYVEKRDEVLGRRNDGFLKAVFAKGLTVDLSRLDQWKEEMEYLGVEVPEKPLEQKVEYIQTEAIANAEDMIEAITTVLGESGIPEEELANVRAMFRNSIRRNTSGEAASEEIEVAVEPDIYGDGNSAFLGGVASQRLLQGE